MNTMTPPLLSKGTQIMARALIRLFANDKDINNTCK